MESRVAFVWVSRVPGLRVTAGHRIERIGSGTQITLSIRYEGLLAGLLLRWMGDLNERYLALEAEGLSAHCAKLAASAVLT